MAGAEAVERAHELYRGGRHREALELYSAALAAARGHAQRIALHSNRAACYLKLHDFHKAAEECTSVLELDTEHAGALMLRAQTLVTLKDYQSALFDVNRLIEINPSSEVYRNLHARLKTQLSLAPIPESDEESLYTEEDKEDLPPKDNTKNETALVKSDQPSAKLIPENKPVTKALKVEVPPNPPSKPEGTIQKPKGHSELDYKEPLTEAPKVQVSPGLYKEPLTEVPKVQVSPNLPSKPEYWGTIQKPNGHSGLDYSKWDKVEDDSSEDDEDDDEDDLPRYKFKVRTIGVRTVK
ncbi:protein unc-45A [Hordeum vulgare]|nr:protein unc-45A [Hordeum vulgare]